MNNYYRFREDGTMYQVDPKIIKVEEKKVTQFKKKKSLAYLDSVSRECFYKCNGPAQPRTNMMKSMTVYL